MYVRVSICVIKCRDQSSGLVQGREVCVSRVRSAVSSMLSSGVGGEGPGPRSRDGTAMGKSAERVRGEGLSAGL